MSKPGPSTSGGSKPSPSTSGEGNPKKPSYFSLTKKTLPELKKMCADAKLPRTGNKSQLMSSLIWGFKPNYESLGKLNVAEMKKMCADANLPKTGTKDQLMARIIDGGSGQTAQKKGGKGQKSAQKEAVNKLFRDAGEDPNQINKCLKAGILNGHVPLTEEGKLNLDQVLHKGRCDSCRDELTCTIRDALYQREYAGLDYEDGGYYAAVHCETIAVGTTSLASAMGRSPSTLGSTTTIVGDAPISGTASEITAIDAMANQDATAKVRFVGLGYVNFIFSLYD